ncbi:MAG: FAD-dependent oxidoreductase [Pseudomonadota bacterium]
MKRIFPAYAYGSGPRNGCWWDQTIEPLDLPALDSEVRADVAIVGAGFTGISAALHLAELGAEVVVLEAETVGWGASGRNGGFCCLGGSMASDDLIDRKFSKHDRLAWRRTEKTAVSLVSDLIERLDIDVDRHSKGETRLAHSARTARAFETEARRAEENYGMRPILIEGRDLARHGMDGSFHGGLTVPVGFALNPRKYLLGLANAAQQAGARIFSLSPVIMVEETAGKVQLETPSGNLHADQVVIATNGYSSENVPRQMAGQYMPVQSNVLVTRPLSDPELERQGWTTQQMCYDSLNLLHYFRLMPDSRFLFGMRGGLFSSARAEQGARRATEGHFRSCFPAWSKVEIEYAWSGFACLSRKLFPFVGLLHGSRRISAALCYHGNGVAMATYAGALLADRLSGTGALDTPAVMNSPLKAFPLGRWRRALMPPAYGLLRCLDRLA